MAAWIGWLSGASRVLEKTTGTFCRFAPKKKRPTVPGPISIYLTGGLPAWESFSFNAPFFRFNTAGCTK